MITQFDLDNIEEFRKLNNYKVIDNDDVTIKKCLICFSSNGLYFPNSNERLEAIIENDYYEWTNLLGKDFKRVVYLRDIYKQWYIKGINSEINSIEKLAKLLQSLTKGYDITIVGSSAGGYAGVLLSQFLNDSKVIAFAPQFDIRTASQCPVRNKVVHSTCDYKYFDISKTCSNIYYFLPIKSDIDVEQSVLIKNNKNIKLISINSNIHGVPFYPFSIRNLVKLSDKRLMKLTGVTHNKLAISLLLANFEHLRSYIKIKLKKHFKK